MNLGFLNPPVTKEELGFGKVAVPRRTAFRMRDIIRQSSANEYVRKWAERIVQDVPDRDRRGEVAAVFHFLQTRTRYANDPLGTEYIQTPPYVLKQIEMDLKPSLDCDDYTVTGLSLLRSLGYTTAIRVVGFTKKSPDKFTHVYGMVQLDGGWMPFDCVRKDRGLGWEAPGQAQRMDIKV